MANVLQQTRILAANHGRARALLWNVAVRAVKPKTNISTDEFSGRFLADQRREREVVGINNWPTVRFSAAIESRLEKWRTLVRMRELGGLFREISRVNQLDKEIPG